MRETTSCEFVDWQKYFDLERNIPRREDYYLAQIASEIRRGLLKNPNSVRIANFLLKFTSEEKRHELTEADIQKRAAASKAHWFAITGMPPRNPPHQEE